MTKEQLEKGINLQKNIKEIENIIKKNEPEYELYLIHHSGQKYNIRWFIPEALSEVFKTLKYIKSELEKELENL